MLFEAELPLLGPDGADVTARNQSPEVDEPTQFIGVSRELVKFSFQKINISLVLATLP